jgi:ABC-2 type transport system permease protein
LWVVPVAGVVLSVVGSVLVISAFKDQDLAGRLSEHGPLRFGPTNLGLILLVFGIRVFADESHHHTLAATYIAAPRRRRVFAAKAIVAAGVAAAVCGAVFALVVPVTLVGAGVRGISMSADWAATSALLLRTVLAMTMTAVVGVACAAIARNRAVVLVGALLWLALLESVVGAMLKIPELLPGAVVRAVISGHGGSDALAAGPAALVLLAICAASLVPAIARLDDDVA